MASLSKLPAQAAQLTVDNMTDMLRRLGDLAAYIFGVAEDGTITLGLFMGPTICVTLPTPTALHSTINDAQLGKALAAVEALDSAIANGAMQPYAQPRMACLHPVTGKVDLALTRRLRRRPNAVPIVLPPGLLPRLGPEQIKLLIAGLRRDLADLSWYIDTIGESKAGRLVYIFDHVSGTPLDLADATPLEGLSDKNRFGVVAEAIKLMNVGYRSGGFMWEKRPT